MAEREESSEKIIEEQKRVFLGYLDRSGIDASKTTAAQSIISRIEKREIDTFREQKIVLKSGGSQTVCTLSMKEDYFLKKTRGFKDMFNPSDKINLPLLEDLAALGFVQQIAPLTGAVSVLVLVGKGLAK